MLSPTSTRRVFPFMKLAAPTGRAAKRMADLTGAQAQTIHRLLEVDFAKGGAIPAISSE